MTNPKDAECGGSITSNWYPGYMTVEFSDTNMKNLALATSHMFGDAKKMAKEQKFDKLPICYRT